MEVMISVQYGFILVLVLFVWLLFFYIFFIFLFFFFFFQAEDGIRDGTVTGVQTCALPIFSKLQNLGLSLAEIQELVREQDGSGSATVAAQKLKEAYVQRLSETRRKLEELRELEAELKDSLAYLTACDSACESQVPVHSCPSCERHPEREHAPELVTAVHVV